VDIVITGEPAQVRDAAVALLESRGFRFTWTDHWSATAEKGSKVGNVLAGALAQYFAVGLRVMAGHPGQTIVRFDQLNTGWMGGAIGAHRVSKNLDALRDDFAGWFHHQGLLVGVQPA
jgi:hypothetical protein